MLNRITIMGRLVADPELKKTNSGIKVTSFRIACDRDNSENKTVDFIDCVAWRQKAEFVCKYFKKGKPILIEGRLQIREYKDRDGKTQRVAEINVDTSHFCGGDRVNNSVADAGSQIQELPDDDGDLPWKMDGDDDLPL